MKLAWPLLGAIVVGLAVGLALGWVTTTDRRTAPPLAGSLPQELAEVPTDDREIGPPAAPTPALPAPATPDASNASIAGAGLDADTAADPDDALLVPAAFDGDAPPAFDPHLLPRGPGRFALIDLSPSGLAAVPVRAGKLDRDGPAPPHLFQKAMKVTLIRAPGERVELLHLGYDREATPVLAHVRTLAGVEGVIALVQGDLRIPLLPDPEAADIAAGTTPADVLLP
jgi:hypothetical protein